MTAASAGDPLPPPDRRAFSLPPDLHYLNCAYMSPLPRPVEAAGARGLREKRDPSRITSATMFAGVASLRAAFARLAGAADPERVAVVPSVSYAFTTVARNERLRPGDRVVVAGEQFPSHVYPWRRACAEGGAELVTVAAPGPGPGRGAGWSERLLEAVDARTAVVALPAHHWTDGTRFDLETIGGRAREVGAALVVDVTQTLGAVPLDLGRLRPDAIACAGYKWLLGPYSLGVAWFGERYDGGAPIEEGWWIRPGSEDFRRIAEYRDEYRPRALRYDVGEVANPILVPMLTAALELLAAWGVATVATACRRLTDRIAAGAAELGLGVEDEEWRGPHILGLRLPPGADPVSLRERLARWRVHVSVRGSAVRVSPHVYNDAADVEALLEALRASIR